MWYLKVVLRLREARPTLFKIHVIRLSASFQLF